jgi:UDP-glucose:(heptosyl)LPS alpha-1,3-glucosyltransferase
MCAQNSPKIFFLKRTLNALGGLEKAAKFLIDGFIKKGFDTHLLTTSKSNFNTTLHPIKKKKGFSFQKISYFDKACTQFLKNQSYSAVFGLDRNSFQTHIRAGNGCHKAYLQSRLKTDKAFLSSLNPLHRLVLSIEKKSFENPDLRTLFTNSHMVKKEILSFYNVDEKKIQVVHNGVEWKNYSAPFQLSLENRPYQTLGLNPHTYQILFIGHNYKRKGLEVLLKALSHFSNRSFQLSVLGKDKNLSYFKKLAYSLHLEEKVLFFGQQKNTLPFYQCADCLAIPSFYDPFANVTVEALAMGLFVLSSKSNGGAEVLTDQTGTMVKDLLDLEEMIENLKVVFSKSKTKERSQSIRNSIKHLDFSLQLDKIILKTSQTLV